MKKRAIIMGMPVAIEIVDANAKEEDIAANFAYFHFIDKTFSTYKTNSEVMRINRGEIKRNQYSSEMTKILFLAEQTKNQTNGYFNIERNGVIDPSGLVKGYAIHEAAQQLKLKGYQNFYINIAGDIEVVGKRGKNKKWSIGIENPFERKTLIKIVYLSNQGIATSGTYIRGNHIYNPINGKEADDVASITVIAENVYEADRFVTAAFAMGEKGIAFIQGQKNMEGYMIRKDGKAMFTTGFMDLTKN